MTNITEYSEAMPAEIMDHINTLKYFSTQKDSPKPPDTTTTGPANRRGPPLESRSSAKIGGMWTLKHETRLPKFYELLIKTELKGETAMELNKFFNNIKMCLNAVTRL